MPRPRPPRPTTATCATPPAGGAAADPTRGWLTRWNLTAVLVALHRAVTLPLSEWTDGTPRRP